MKAVNMLVGMLRSVHDGKMCVNGQRSSSLGGSC